MTSLMRDQIGIFSGFGDSRYEIVSQVLLPYRSRSMPLQGAFLVVGLDDLQGRESAVLGRVTRAVPTGDLFTPAGEDYLVEMVRLGKQVPEEVKEGRLRYRVSLRLLGQLSLEDEDKVVYTPSIRQMPHVGAPVGFPSDKVMNYIAAGCPDVTTSPGPVIGHLAVGDLAFDGGVQVRGRELPVRFRMDSLVGRRTAIFARAGMGKSNFTKVLLSRLYESADPEIPGTLVIDPEGEYAFANASEPGLLDVVHLRDKVIVYTSRSDFDSRYQGAVRGSCLLNLGDLAPAETVRLILPDDKQDLVFANTLRSLHQDRWRRLIAYLAENRYQSSMRHVGELCGKRNANEYDVVSGAIVNNLVPVIERLHSSSSTLVTDIQEALRRGMIVIVDVSMLAASDDAKLIAAWVLRAIFANNQSAYTSTIRREGRAVANRRLIPCLAVFEEAQFYLGGRRLREDSPFVRWFKEGRKFSLGSILVTQQPGAIGPELISQCDNFFVFHLLSKVDLDALAVSNLHYGGDIASSISQEPIPGNCFLWSGRGLAFVTCARILEFAKVVAEAEKRVKPVELVATALTEQPRQVSLPLQDLHLGVEDHDAYLLEALRKAMAEDPKVHLFDLSTRGQARTADSVCVSAVYTFVRDSLRRSFSEHQKARRIPEGFDTERGASAHALLDLLSRHGHSPVGALAPDANGREHLVVRRSFLGDCRKSPRHDGPAIEVEPAG